ncbi:hypothetical protein K8R33_03115 [archaeon]|nr:hypothetical protein [archaeon]
MGLFKHKNKKINDDFAQEVPQFKPFSDKEDVGLPDLPSSNRDKEMFPSYEREFSGIKKEIQKPVFTMPKVHAPLKKQENFRPAVEKASIVGDKPIYVKIDQYKDAMTTIDRIKELCNEADKKLGEISRLRSSEDRELEKWQDDVDNIKDKLLQIDKKLFEV